MSVTRRELLAAGIVSVAGWSIRPRACAAESSPQAAGFRLEKGDGHLQVFETGSPVFTYNFADQLKEGVPADRKRSCYIHPLCGLDGEVLTDDFPKDHHHHRGLSWMWQRVKAGGREVDLWTIKGIRQHFSKWLEEKAGADGAVAAVENQWVMDGPPVVKETVRLQVHPAEAAGRAIDVDIGLEALAGAVELRGEIAKGYGGLGIRFAPREETVITTERGRQAKDSDHLRFAWADLSARFAGRTQVSGVAVFVHPWNPGAPNEWTLRNYGFLGPCWPGMEACTLEPGKPVRMRYRLWVHRGDAAAGKAAEAYEKYRAACKA